jgi:hypothetical protein
MIDVEHEEIIEMITFNQKRLRYQFIYVYGYAIPFREEDSTAGTTDTPAIQIGRCSEM